MFADHPPCSKLRTAATGDVDGGSATDERFTLTAYDAGGAAITTPWLTSTEFVWGTGRNGPLDANPPSQLDMPMWAFNASTGEYAIDGRGVNGFNPTIGLALMTLTNINKLKVVKGSQFNGFTIGTLVGSRRRAHTCNRPARKLGRRARRSP